MVITMPKGLAPENDFRGKSQDWERRVFLAADYYSVIIFPGLEMGNKFNRQRTEVKSFPEAMELAEREARALVYAVTDSGRSACLERKHWDSYKTIWPLAKLAGGPGRELE